MNSFYHLFTLKNLEDVGLLSNWLQVNGNNAHNTDKRAVAVALHQAKRGRGGELAFATKDEVTVCDLKSPAADALLGVCRAVLIDQPQIGLLARDLYLDLVNLVPLFVSRCEVGAREVYDRLAPAFVGDLRQAALITGFTAPGKATFKQTADDAFDVALTEPQYSSNLPNQYYSKVSLPAARMWAEGKLFKTDANPGWLCSYRDLWLRVLAHYTGDPTLTFAFHEQRDVVEVVAGTLKVTGAQALALLLWQTHDRDLAALSARFPLVVDELPDNLPKWAQELDKHYPTLVASILQMRQAYWESRAAHTLYGRKLRPGHSSGVATAFRIFGTVEDILSVAAVSMWQNRTSADILVTGIGGGAAARELQIYGQGPAVGRDMWRHSLGDIAPLGSPIRIALQPQVVLL